MTTQRAPRGLQSAGRRLWQDVTAGIELRPSGYDVLLEACRTADELARLHEVLASEPATVTGSTGQPRMHPAFDEARRHRDLLAKLLGALVPDEPAGSSSVAGSVLALKRHNPRGA